MGIEILILSGLGIAVVVTGAISLWTYASSESYNPNAVTVCPCCEQLDENCNCNCC